MNHVGVLQPHTVIVGSITTTTLTVTTVLCGAVANGQKVSGAGVTRYWAIRQ